MAGWFGKHRGSVRRLGASVAVGGLLAGGAVVPAQASSQAPTVHRPVPRLPKVPAARDVGVLHTSKVRVHNPAASHARVTAATWPAAGLARITLSAVTAPLTATGEQATRRSLLSPGAQVFGTGTPVWAQAAAGRAVTGLGVRVLGHAAAVAAGVRGVLFTARTAPGSGGGAVRLGLSYAGFAQVSGGNFGLGLGIAELPACALTTPARPACEVEKPLASVNDAAARTVSAVVTLPGGTGARSGSSSAAAGRTVVLAAAPADTDGGGAAGTYSATTLKPSGTWSESGSTGAFTFDYPLPVPPAASSLTPQLSLRYDSGSVDGQTASTQAQASWVGDGWSTPQAYVEQSFIPCADNPEGSAAPKSTQDDCYNGPILTLSMDGSSVPLVCPSPFSYTTTSKCTLSSDNGEVVTHHVSSGNGSGTKFTDYWTVTDRTGKTSYFGLNHLPGWASGDPATNSVDSVPVFSAHSGDPCYSSSGFGSSVCTMAYRWNMDYVTDLHGNAMAYYYDQSKNAYAENGGTSSATSYIRDSHLDHIDYGFTDGHAYGSSAPDEVVFATSDRCFTGTCDPLNNTNAANWLDVPYTQDNCSAGASCQVTGPTFWSTVRLGSIATQQWNGTKYVPVDTWTLAQHFPATGDETSPALWLDSITHTGNDTTAGGSAVTLPALSFAGADFANRVNPGNFPALDRYRITQITTETGAVISMTYELTNPCSPTSEPTPSSNTSSCFPVFWQDFSPPTPDWFNKYALESVSVADPTGGAPSEFTSYSYSGAAWHYDDNEVVQPKYRTYGQWRGYQDVKTFTGTGTDAKTESETTYYQGMDGDTLPGGSTRSVTLTDSQGGKHTDSNQLSGQALETTQYNFAGGPVDNSTINSYWVSAAAATRTRSGLPDLTANATGLVETWSRQAITDGGTTTWRKTETDTSYDSTPSDTFFGLPMFVYSHGDLSDSSQQTCASTTYAPANTSEDLVGLPAEVETDAAACGGSSPSGASAPGSGQVNALTAPAGLSRPADVVSDTRTYYDNPTLAQNWPQPASPSWPQAAPTLGDASVVRVASDYTGGAFTYQTKSATVYDSYGRPVTAYDANGNKTTTSYTMTNGVTTAEKVTNPLGQASATTYDPLRGLSVSQSDLNGITTTLHYNGLGWLTGVWGYNRPAATSPANDTFSYAVSSTAPTVVTTQKLNDESGYVTSTTLLDALLRARQTQTPTPQGGMLVTDNFYDSRGWLWKTNTGWWDSTASPGSKIVTVPDSQVPNQTVTAFDGLDRPVLVTSYDDSAVKSTTATAYYGDRVTNVPPTGGAPTSTVTDALGRTTELDSYTSPPTVNTSTANGITAVTITGGTTQATDYAYNHRGELLSIKDAASGETWSRSYNLLGEQTGASTPNGGTSSMSYDANGNLTGSTDADAHPLTWTYDALNRKTAEYDGPSTSSPMLASWVYDNSNNVAGVTDPIGQLTTETSYSGSNAYTIQQKGFNVFGESLGQTITLPSAEGALAGSYAITHTYSATAGLALRDTYPASPGGGALPAETVTHGYETGFDLPDGLGGLAAYVQQITYTAFSQIAQEKIGTTSNNAFITNTYDPHTGALTDSQTENSAVSTTPFDDTSYTHDPSGNITSQTDGRNGSQSETQCFSYDTLDRLTQAWTATDNCTANPSSNGGSTVGDGISGSAYWTSWAFDSLGDWTTQTQHSLTGGANTVTSYSYNGNGASQPNTLTSTSTTGPSGTSTASYAYDADGNTVTRNLPSGKQTLIWTHTGRLSTDTTSAGATSYVYDADGNMLLQKDPGQVTFYPFGGAEQLVLNTSTQAITGTRFLALPGGETVVRTGAGSTYSFEINDQHGSSEFTLDSTAANPVWRQFTPYGAPRGQAPASWPDTNGFIGKPTDANTGLSVIGARQYDPLTGRFLSPDPLLSTNNPQQLDGYTYSVDNPVNDSDPSGEMPCADGICGSFQFLEHHFASTSGGGGGGGGGGAPPDPYYFYPVAPAYYGPPGDVRSPLFAPVIDYPVVHPVAAHTAATRSAASTYNPVLCGRIGGSYCSGAQQAIAKIRTGPAPSWLVTGLLGLGAVGLTVVNALQGGLDPATDGLEVADVGALTGDVAGGAAEDAGASASDGAGAASRSAAARAAAACGGESFTAGTKVLLASGAMVPIASLKPGDKVMATDTRTGRTTAEPVTAVLVHHDSNRYDLTVKVAGRTAVIHTTTTHLFWDPATRQWRKAGSLAKGSRLAAPDGALVRVAGGHAARSRSGWMWDLTVASDHDFYVVAKRTAMLVHNCAVFSELNALKAETGADVTARLSLGDESFDGTNLARSNPPIKGTFSFFVEHAEGDAFSQAMTAGSDFSGESGTLYVTQAPCGFCVSGISAAARQMGLSELNIVTPEGPFGTYTPETGLVRTP
jgi:RHS repeat-associated protein